MTLSRRWVRGALCVVLLIVGSVLARAQEVSGSISGTVVDANGASVNGAVVTVTNTDQAHVERIVHTDKAGFYTATSLPLGNYSVTIAMKGFKTASVTGLVVNSTDALKVDQKLVVGAATETVNIVANEATLNLENSNSSGLITGTQIRELVLNNRNYEQLLTLQPGVAYGGTGDQLYIGASLPSGTSAQVAFSINGQRSTANNWTIDGADNVDRGANLTLLAYPSVDAISEVQTLRGTYEAEYGRSASGQVNVVTRSGTTAFHGGAYEFFRNNVFNANNYFNKLSSPFTPRPVLRYNDFGFTLGGPVDHSASLPRPQRQDIFLLLDGVSPGCELCVNDGRCADAGGAAGQLWQLGGVRELGQLYFVQRRVQYVCDVDHSRRLLADRAGLYQRYLWDQFDTQGAVSQPGPRTGPSHAHLQFAECF